MNMSSEREFGEIRTELKNLKENVIRAEAENERHRKTTDEKLDHIQESVQEINSRFDKMDGAWKATVIIGGIAGAVGAGALTLAKWLFSFPSH